MIEWNISLIKVEFILLLIVEKTEHDWSEY